MIKTLLAWIFLLSILPATVGLSNIAKEYHPHITNSPFWSGFIIGWLVEIGLALLGALIGAAVEAVTRDK